MIMWRKRFAFVAVVLVTVLACGPDVGSINISECMRGCNAEAKRCLDESNERLDACGENTLCQRSAIHDTEACMTGALDCISTCVDVMEKKLKE